MIDPATIALVLTGIKIAGAAIDLGKTLWESIREGESAPAIAQMRETIADLEALQEQGKLPEQAVKVLAALKAALAAAESNPELVESAFDLFHDGLGLFQRKLTDAQLATLAELDAAAANVVAAGNRRPAKRTV